MGLFQPLFTHSYVLRLTWGLGVFACLVPFTLLFSVLNWMDGMLHIWTIWTAAMGMSTLVHGERPPLDEPSVWVANHFNWFDWSMLQAAARWPQRVYAIVKADLAVESSVVGWILVRWCRNLGAIFYTRGDKSSGATVRSTIAEFPGTILVFPEGTTQAYGPPMLDKMRLGSIAAAYESGKTVQPVAIYYSLRVGLGFGLEANGLRQTALLCYKPSLGVTLFCKPLRPADFKTADAMGEAAKTALSEGYASLEARYKDWPLVHEKAN